MRSRRAVEDTGLALQKGQQSQADEGVIPGEGSAEVFIKISVETSKPFAR